MNVCISNRFVFEKFEGDVYRTNFQTEKDVQEWLEEYSVETNTKWIVRNAVYNPQRLIYHKHFVCQHACKNKKKPDSNRNTKCSSSIDVKIKKCNKGTRKNDIFLRREIPLPGIVKMKIDHNHAVDTAGSLKLLRIDKPTKDKFMEYFSDGLGISESIKQHENKLLLNITSENFPETAANARINPTYSMVKHLYNNWRKLNFGSVNDNVTKIKEKIPFYAERGITINLVEGSPWSILVVTPIMKRCHKLIQTGEIIFLDSTCSVDASHSTLTIMLTASKAGALPICMLIHEGQTQESYERAFQLLKNYNDHVFGGNKSPKAFMTDNSAAEKNALRLVWPDSKQLLCHFHVAQAEWRWLLSSKNKIPLEERPNYMKKFQKVLYATTTEEFEQYASDILESNMDENYKKRFLDFLNIRCEWGLCFRLNNVIRGHNTNNYSEATMRIMKDIILQRTKAFNAVALVDYCCTVWEQYSKNRLINFANGRNDNSFYKLNLLETRTKNFDVSLIKNVDDNVFIVPSLSNKKLSYEVNCELGCCTCIYGLQGAFCKHQYLINKHFKKILPNAPLISASDKYSLAKLALGDELSQDLSFFTGLKILDGANYCELDLNLPTKNKEDCISEVEPPTTYKSSEEAEIETNLLLLKNNLERVSNLLPKTTVTNKYLKNLNIQLEKITNSQNALDKLMQVSTVFCKKGGGGVIKVQPTAIARRREGVSRGCKRINSGRPALIKNKKVKRKHNLSENVQKNKANAILH